MESEKKQRGGARANAGRKKLDNARNIRASFMLSAKAFDYLQKIATENNTTKNDIMNILLEKMADE